VSVGKLRWAAKARELFTQDELEELEGYADNGLYGACQQIRRNVWVGALRCGCKLGSETAVDAFSQLLEEQLRDWSLIFCSEFDAVA